MPGENTTEGGGGTPPDGQQETTFEGWLREQTEEVQGLIGDHIQGLRSALQSEREQRREFERQLREATEQLEEGSEARQALESMTSDLEAANRRADFYEDAARPEVGCSNPRLAFVAAHEIDAFDRKGNPDWDAIKGQFPELFGSTAPPGNAGSGAGQQDGTPVGGMNSFIRRAAGRE